MSCGYRLAWLHTPGKISIKYVARCLVPTRLLTRVSLQTRILKSFACVASSTSSSAAHAFATLSPSLPRTSSLRRHCTAVLFSLTLLALLASHKLHSCSSDTSSLSRSTRSGSSSRIRGRWAQPRTGSRYTGGPGPMSGRCWRSRACRWCVASSRASPWYSRRLMFSTSTVLHSVRRVPATTVDRDSTLKPHRDAPPRHVMDLACLLESGNILQFTVRR